MTLSSRRIPIAVGIGVSALGIATAWAGLRSSLPVAPSPVVVVVDLAAGLSFALVGVLLWTRFEQSRIGLLTVLVGFASFLADLRWFPYDITWTVGWMTGDIHLLVLAAVVMAFPSGRLRRVEWTFVIAAGCYFALLNVAGNLFEVPAPGCAECPDSLVFVRSDPPLADRIWDIGQIGNLVILGLLVGIIVRKWSDGTPPARRAMSPVVWALWPIGIALAAAFFEPLLGFESGTQVVLIGERLALMAFPAALMAGMIRTDLARGRVAELARRVDQAADSEQLESLVRDALGDPSAGLAYWSDAREQLIDADGQPSAPRERQRNTELTREGERLGSIFHDDSIDPELVAAVGATASLALHNERLRAELRAQLTELAASRARIAKATLNERRRLERNLHDGAQQRLLALAALLGRARLRATPEVAALLEDAALELRETADDLRELARGVHPGILTERGLVPALRALAERSPVPVTISAGDGRCRPASEAAAYFLVAEALANATRHAGAAQVVVTVQTDGPQLDVEVQDDGIGGAEPTDGTGLQNLIDRFEALGGDLEITSPNGGGTLLRGTLPCG